MTLYGSVTNEKRLVDRNRNGDHQQQTPKPPPYHQSILSLSMRVVICIYSHRYISLLTAGSYLCLFISLLFSPFGRRCGMYFGGFRLRKLTSVRIGLFHSPLQISPQSSGSVSPTNDTNVTNEKIAINRNLTDNHQQSTPKPLPINQLD